MPYQTRCDEPLCQYLPILRKDENEIRKMTLFVFWHKQEVHYGSYQLKLRYVKGSIILINRRQRKLPHSLQKSVR